MAEEGAIECLILLLDSTNDLIQRQSAKALANLGVNADNKPKIAEAGGIPKLIRLAGTPQIAVRIEAIAALANLAVNGIFFCWIRFKLISVIFPDSNELEIVRCNGLDPVVLGAALAADSLEHLGGKSDKEIGLLEELATQCARALRNLSVNRK